MAKNRSYHHGDLRTALLEAAQRLVARAGTHQVSLRAIAREAGVSHAAPYHHFGDRDELLAALAASGFDALREAMEQSAQEGRAGNPLNRLQRAGVAYVRFAAAHPELYRLMFSGPMSDRARFPDLQRAADEAFNVLQSLLRGPGRGSGRKQAPAYVATTAWSTVHGLAMLLIDGRIVVDSKDGGVESVAKEVTRILGRGLRSYDAPR